MFPLSLHQETCRFFLPVPPWVTVLTLTGSGAAWALAVAPPSAFLWGRLGRWETPSE